MHRLSRTTRPLLLCALALGLHTAAAGAQQAGVHPADEAAFALAIGVKKAGLAEGPGWQVWSDEPRLAADLGRQIAKAALLAEEMLGTGLPPETSLRIVVLDGEQTLGAYFPLAQKDAAARKASPPDAAFLAGVVGNGSGLWTNPPLLLVNSKLLHGNMLDTRAIHDLGAVFARYACSPWGGDPPEFLQEGFAGVLMRLSLKRPAGLVSHQGAALTERIHGYGVFAGISGANDSSNESSVWPSLLRTVVKQMRKDQAVDPKARIDALLRRTAAEFARLDYAYSWGAVAFLTDPQEPYGADALAAAASKAKRATEPLENSRRTGLHKVLAELRQPDHAALPTAARAELLVQLLLHEYGEDPDGLHEGFMSWVETGMPKK
ncbi:MAG TPA: hypothetical protein VGC54_01000 [Planctomycetota bacterium]